MEEIKEIDNLAEEYTKIDSQIKRLEAQKEALREIIAKYTPDKGYAGTFFKSSWVTKKNWEYSDKIEKMEEEIKKEKKIQQLEGAKFTETKIFKIEVY